MIFMIKNGRICTNERDAKTKTKNWKMAAATAATTTTKSTSTRMTLESLQRKIWEMKIIAAKYVFFFSYKCYRMSATIAFTLSEKRRRNVFSFESNEIICMHACQWLTLNQWNNPTAAIIQKPFRFQSFVFFFVLYVYFYISSNNPHLLESYMHKILMSACARSNE